jgi:hypothetical protein
MIESDVSSNQYIEHQNHNLIWGSGILKKDSGNFTCKIHKIKLMETKLLGICFLCKKENV